MAEQIPESNMLKLNEKFALDAEIVNIGSYEVEPDEYFAVVKFTLYGRALNDWYALKSITVNAETNSVFDKLINELIDED